MTTNLWRTIQAAQTEEFEFSDAEKERIMENLKKETHRRSGFGTVLKSAAGLAAAFVMLVTASMFNPVLAANIPFMENIVGFLRQNHALDSGVYSNGAVEKHMVPVSVETDEAFSIRDSYFDGTVLAVTIAARLPEADTETVEMQFELEINGETPPIQIEPVGGYTPTATLYRAEDSCFVGTVVRDISAVAPSSEFALTITPTSFASPNGDFLSLVPSAAAAEITQNEDADVYPVKGIQTDGLTITELRATPAFTYVNTEFTAPGTYTYILTLDSGEKLDYIRVGDYDQQCYYEALPVGTKYVTIDVYEKADARKPVCSATVTVTDGYSDGDAVKAYEDARTGDGSQSDWLVELARRGIPVTPREGETAVELGETIISRTYSETNQDQTKDSAFYLDPDAVTEITYDNMQVYASHTDAGIDDADMNESGIPDDLSEYRFVTFDVHIETKGTPGIREDGHLQPEIEAYGENDGTAGIQWIENYAHLILETDFNFGIDIPYFSGHMRGFTNYYHFASNAYDSHDFVVGFYVPTAAVESGNWLIGVENGEHNPDYTFHTVYTYYTIPPYTE